MAMGGRPYFIAKRIFDVVVSTMGIAVVAIPGAVLCVLIQLETPGSPIFSEMRVGKDGRQFRLYKLRSMYRDANDNREKYLDEGQLRQWERDHKVERDTRITRIGRFIRRTSIDETPQFINVIRGEMSLVGPRPVTLRETFEYGEHRDEVLSVRPGITGLWQATERNEATWENGKRQEIELRYVRSMGVAQDLGIMLRTVLAMVEGTGR